MLVLLVAIRGLDRCTLMVVVHSIRILLLAIRSSAVRVPPSGVTHICAKDGNIPSRVALLCDTAYPRTSRVTQT